MPNRKNQNPTNDEGANQSNSPAISAAFQSSIVDANQTEIPSINLPSGGGSIKGIEEKFQVNSVTGTSTCGIPIPVSPSRSNFIPAIGLNYNSGSGNSAFGVGWDLGIPNISRKTEKGLPQYKDEEDSDTFILSGAEDLIPLLEKVDSNWEPYITERDESGISFTVKRFRPRIEGLFAIIESWKNHATGEIHWRSITGDNTHSYYGLTPESRITDPNDPSRVFEWKLCRTHDDKGNILIYEYKKEDFANLPNKQNEKHRKNNCTQTYIKKILYGNKNPYYLGDDIPSETDFLFKVVFDYGEYDTVENIPQDIYKEKNIWTCRKDSFSNYRSGFEIRTYRRCSRILLFHCFDQPKLPHNPYLVKSLQLFYDDDLDLLGNSQKVEGFSYLIQARQNGHKWNDDTNTYSTKFLPEMEFSYQQHEWNTDIKKVSEESSSQSPIGIDNKQYLWVDLFSEGISGILTEKSEGWYYKSNLGDGNFSKAMPVSSIPNFRGLRGGSTSILELEGDGTKYLVQHSIAPKGFFKLTDEENWESFKHFENYPNFNSLSENMRAIDLSGDGVTDLLFTEENKLKWHRGLGEKGFQVSQTVTKEIDEEKGPAILFADRNQSIFLADMNGDGLTDIVRIRNGEICYWANLGYGKFSAKVGMDNAPIFDHTDAFNPSYLRLADIDGSGTIDIVYLAKNDFRVWMNLSGNEWAKEPQIISPFPEINNLSDVAVFDFLGTGTACIVYSSSLPKHKNNPLQYIDLMGSKKPHLLNKYENNCGKESTIEYKSSTHFYLEDKKEGRKWITKLPFPVHCISKVRTEDKIRETVFTSTYKYSHGYFDHFEKEFRGFGRVEQLDTEDFAQFKLNDAKNVVEEDLHQPPVRTVSWFHTGAFFGKDQILTQFKNEYFQNTEFIEYDLPEAVINDDLSADELREALRALKGMPLRSEVYADDDSLLRENPYSASHSTVEIKMIQPKGNNKHPSFLVIPSESISYGYERNPSDPRISHSFVLETDELGNVNKSAGVVYPRVKRPLTPNSIPDKVWEEQKKIHISYGESSFTNDFIDEAKRVYRLRVGYESKSYEISGISQPLSFFLSKETLKTNIATANEILFEKDFTNGTEKRLLSQSRIYFQKDDLSASLPLGELSSLGIGHKNYQIAYTKNLVTNLFGTKVTDQMLLDAKYVHSEGDENWWTQSGTTIFPANPQDNFYLPIGSRDVFGNESFAKRDDLNFLLESTTDAIGNKTSVINDYRTLSASMLIDPNLNRGEVETDELGMVIKSVAMGKVGDNDGDTLANPTNRLEYDLFNWQNNKKPNYVHSFKREKHGANNPRWQESYVYSDGEGNVILTKSQAEPGKALQWNSVTKEMDEIDADPRWVGNGRTILNNKGNPVKQYEPYFSTTHEYENEDALVETGITPITYYDPVGRNIRAELPDGTFTKVEFDAWFSKSYDVNDTVKDSEWYVQRGSPDPDSQPEPIDAEQRAAWLAAKHYDTPETVHTDSLGNSFYAIKDYGNGKTTSVYSETDSSGRFSSVYDQMGRKVSEGYTNLLGAMVYGKTAEKGENWTFTDVIGRLVKVWDNNLREFRTTYDDLHRPISAFVKEGSNEFLFNHILYADYLFDTATAQSLNLIGRAYRIYDQSGSVTIKNVDFKGNPLEVERKLIKDYKAQIIDWKGLESLTDIITIDNTANPLLEAETFSSSGEADALNRPIRITIPDGTVYQPIYNEANLLDSMQVQLQGQGAFITFLENQNHDAKGQRQYAKYGNGVITEYFYDPKSYRLTNLLTRLSASDANVQAIQNINYTFDPAGNITQIRDDAQQKHFFNNNVVYPENKYVYDACYQLIEATGREHAGLGGNTQRNNLDVPFISHIPHQNDSNAVRIYKEKYEYDDIGNIKRFQHIANNANWTRRYKYEYEDDSFNNTNRLKASSNEGDAADTFSLNYTHDLHGNMTAMPHLSSPDSLIWSFMDQLKEVDLGGGGKAFYVYGNGGSRVRKVIERQGGKIKETIYLGGLEIYRERQGNNAPNLERHTIHITDNTGKIAQVDIKTIDTNNSDPANPLNTNLIRYQYNNHLGSAVLETDENGQIISYEEYHPYGTSAYRVSKSDVDFSLKRYRFSGKEHDNETGFYYFGARYYAPWLGRWTSSDPAGFVDGLNLYRYCSNNPIMFNDPNGTDGRVVSPPYGAFYSAKTKQDILNYANTNEIFITYFPEGSSEGIPMAIRVHATDAARTGVDQDGNSYWILTQFTIAERSARRLRPGENLPEQGPPSESAPPSDSADGTEPSADTSPSSESGDAGTSADVSPGADTRGDSSNTSTDIARGVSPVSNYGSMETEVNQLVRGADNANKAKIGRSAATAIDSLPEASRTARAFETVARDVHAARNASRAASQSRLLPIARAASAFLDSRIWRFITNNPSSFEGIFARRLAQAGGDVVEAYRLMALSSGSGRASATTSARIAGGFGRFLGGVGVLASAYALVDDISTGNYGVVLGDVTGIGAGLYALAGAATTPVGLALAGVSLANIGGDFVGRKVEEWTGSRAWGVAAGTGTGALTGAAFGAAIGSIVPGVGTAVGAAVGAVVGGIAGFIGSFW